MTSKDKLKHRAGVMLAIAEHNQGVKNESGLVYTPAPDKSDSPKRERCCRSCKHYTLIASGFGFCDNTYIVKKTRRKVWAGWTCNDFTDKTERTLFDG